MFFEWIFKVFGFVLGSCRRKGFLVFIIISVGSREDRLSFNFSFRFEFCFRF